MGVSKESFCRLPQLWERVRLESRRKGLTEFFLHTLVFTNPISLHGLRPSFFPFFPYPFLASRLCQISLLIWYRSRRSTVSWKNSGGPLPTFVSTPYLALKAKLAERASKEK
jgi:hypothetical protein